MHAPSQQSSAREPTRQRAAKIVQEVLLKRATGKHVTDEQIVELYPEISTELRSEFALAARIHHAKIWAERAGPPLEKLRLLTDSELEKPIELSSTSGLEDASDDI